LNSGFGDDIDAWMMSLSQNSIVVVELGQFQVRR
jgi:hypothetical protein